MSVQFVPLSVQPMHPQPACPQPTCPALNQFELVLHRLIMWTSNRWQYICGYHFGKSWWISILFTCLVDYGLCHMICHSATCVWDYETRIHDIDKLQQLLLHVWCTLEQLLIDDAVSWPMLVLMPEADILNTLCDYQFVLSVLDELYVSHHVCMYVCMYVDL